MWRHAPLRLALGYFAFAALLLAPAWARGQLVGHPDVDIWNHIWGYWFVADALGSGRLPWHTNLLGAPQGGTLYFVDLPGALATTPLTVLFGAGLSWNLTAIARVAAAGFFAHLLSARLSGEGGHNTVAGVAYATTPFLWCEIGNGISEVVATGWIPALLWLGERAREGSRRDAVIFGVAGGLSVWANFYYAATAALLVGMGWAWMRSNLRGFLLAAATGLLVGGPALLAIRASVEAPDALVRRSAELNRQLAAHNAVDPRVYGMPGDFQSVDLAATYGEPFLHTGYLRWSVILLAAYGLWRLGRPGRRWASLGAVSLLLGLGPYLWWGGDFVRVGGSILSLPFAWLQGLIPDLAITHPLRLSIGAQAIVAALAGAALVGRPRAWVAAAAALVTLEMGFGSAATWPAPSSPSHVPEVYARIAADPDPRGVLDLPAEVGTTMATSAVFWYQTVHGRPVPYKPDARAGSAGDPLTFTRFFPHPMGRPGQRPAWALPALGPAGVTHLAATYGWIVLHLEWAERAGATGAFEAALTPVLGPSIDEEGLRVWRIPPSSSTMPAPPGPR